MSFRKRFFIGFVMAAIGVVLGGLAQWFTARPGLGLPPSAPIALYTLSGVLVLLGLTLGLFGKIALGPWFGIDLKGTRPALSIGPSFMAFVIGGEPRKGWCIRFLVPGTYLSISWLSRVLIRASLAAFAARWAFLKTAGDGAASLRHTLTAGIAVFVVGILIERGLLSAFAPPPELLAAGEAAATSDDAPPPAEVISEI